MKGIKIMKVKVVRPIKFLYQGNYYTMGQEFEYDGKMNEYLAPVGKQSTQTPKVEAVQEKAEVVQPKAEAVQAKVVVKDDTQVEIFDDIDFSGLSPESIKAKIKEIESAQVKTAPVVEKIEETVEKPKYEVVKVARGWYNVIDADGNELSPKKLRKDDAEELLGTLL